MSRRGSGSTFNHTRRRHTHACLGAAAFIKFCCVPGGGGSDGGAGGGLALTAGVACYFNKLQVESGSKRGRSRSRSSQWEEADLNTELIQAEIGKSKKKKQKKAKQNRKREA